MKTFSKQETNEWLERRATKKSSSAVVFRNTENQWLLLQLTYKEGLGLPGGNAEKNESPSECAIREVKEEIGLDINLGRLLLVHYIFREKYDSESIQFYFDGGTLSDEQISKIILQEDEIEEYFFIDENKVSEKMYKSMSLRFPYLKKAIDENIVTYFETKK